ncbi:MAG: Stk1 family PASTA domain-containing Ser/Thr kinase [Clostridia bacterium]|nr:Stk1 family PASTA domain-containing Ser/Thr kinase [Clostridia bacterium]
MAMELFEKYVGQIFDRRYKIKNIIGIGGMAVVFEAHDLLMNRTVAVKMLKEEINDDAQSVKRFINESRAVSMLNHPNVVNIFDVSVKDDIKYIVMEYIHGITLKNYMNRKGVIGWKEALYYMEQILKGLEHAHAKGIIHRDIKPQNIMLLKNGVIKVTDFGIAKLPNTETVTMTDKAIGTVYYISPEQASGRNIDPRSDLYSLGAMLYEMVTGQLPFFAETSVSVALMQVNDNPIPPTELNPSLPKGLEQLILCAMEKDPDHRYQSTSEMLRCVMQLRARPDTVFQPRLHEIAPEEEEIKRGYRPPAGMTEKQKTRRKKRGSRSMFPVILGVALSFMIMMGIAVFYVLSQLIIADREQDFKTIEIENFVGQIYSEQVLAQMENSEHYVIEIERVYDGEYPENTVIAQDPTVGTTRKVSLKNAQKCRIKLTISKGAESFKLADLTNQEYRQVKMLLERMGLKTRIEEDYHDTALDGYVYRMEPNAGETVVSGDTVTLYVSKGQQIEYVTVPSFLGLTKEQAVKLLIEHDLALGKISYVASDLLVGTILSQSKPEFASVPKSATKIDFTISGGADYVPEGAGTESAEDVDTEALSGEDTGAGA